MAEPSTIQLADIVAPITPPPAPPPYGWVALGAGFALIVALVTVRLWWLRTRHRREALSQLKQAEQALQQQTLEPRAVAFAAAQAIRHAIPKTQPVRTPEFQAYLSALDQARYAPQVPSATDARQLIVQTRHWIARTPC